MTFFELNYINETDNPTLEENIFAKDYMCKHCNRIKLSLELIESLKNFYNEIEHKPYIILGYQCKELCEDNNEDPNNSHTKGNAVDIHFDKKLPLVDILNVALKYFPCIGINRAITGEYYLHLQYDTFSLYWLCGKKEIEEESEYLYFRNAIDLKECLLKNKETFENVMI
jgi:hypothetical protein